MSRVCYIDSYGSRHEMDGSEFYIGIGSELRSYQWAYTIGAKRISGITRNARDVSLGVSAFDLSYLDSVRRAADADLVRGNPGTIEADGWTQRAYIVGAEVDSYSESSESAQLKFKAVLLEGVWRKATSNTYSAGGTSEQVLNFPYNYEHDFGIEAHSDTVTIKGSGDSPVSLIVYGPAVNPSIEIGGNAYTVNTTVQSGEYLVVDGVNHTVYLIKTDGTSESKFADAVRSSGRGSGEYIFEELPPGSHSLSWDSSFGFDLTTYQVESVPTWSL